MKNKLTTLTLALLALAGQVTLAAPLGTAFTYQGKLDSNGQPANGNYTLSFALAAIQGLNQKVEDRSQESAGRSQRSEVRIQKIEAENVDLKARLERLEKLLSHAPQN